MTAKKYTLVQILFVICIILFSFIDVYMYKKGYFSEKKVTLKYQENNDIDYKVYLKKNDFFDDKYLEKSQSEIKTYITSLIDHINVDYKYNIQYDHPVTGEYKYYVYATVESNKSNGEAKYWSKDYKLTDENTMKVRDLKEYTIHENMDIDYNKFNNILISFKKTLGLSGSAGVLKVYLNVESDVVGNEVPAEIDNKLLLSLPLSEMTIEASINSDAHNNIKEVSKVVDSDKLNLTRGLGVVYAASVIFFIFLLIHVTKRKKDLNKYENELKKILNTYDSIIVNINKLPEIKDYKVIDVSSFEELLDAHGEVRMPINYYKDVNRSYFLLLSDTTVWKYVMSKRKVERM